jgi:hypoxanthine phosphoribosyltransferase
MPVVRGKDIEVLFSASAIARRNLELAKEIAERDYHDLLVISILKGSFIFAADLIRAMHDVGLSPGSRVHLHLQLRRGHDQRRGARAARHRQRCRRPRRAVDRRHPGIWQDAEIHPQPDAGTRRAELFASPCCSTSTCAARPISTADFVGFDCPDHFVVGYGMDVAHAFRELPFVGVVKGDA